MNPTAASSMRLARIAGLLYVVVAICAAFTCDYVMARVYLPGDAPARAPKQGAKSCHLRTLNHS